MNDAVPLEIVLNGRAGLLHVQMHDSLLDVLRRARLCGVKRVCETADCGACSVLLNGRVVDSCSTLALQADGARVDTIEGLAHPETLHPLQAAFLNHAAAQCGFCIPGMILSMYALLESTPDASDAELREVMTLCRCTGYVKPMAAVREYQETLRLQGASRPGGETPDRGRA